MAARQAEQEGSLTDMPEAMPSFRMVDRYELVPQMRVYDALANVLVPYLTAISRPNTETDTVNTDENGFRLSYDGDALVDIASWRDTERRGIVLGGSFAFGQGATNDRATFVSHLNSSTDYSFLNLGMTGGNSLQELIAAIPFLAEADCIVVCSGINNLLTSLQSMGEYDLYAPVFTEELFIAMRAYPWEYVANLARSPLSALKSKEFWRAAIADARSRFGKAVKRGGGGRETRTRADPKEAAVLALRRQRRDLAVLNKSRAPASRLLFVAQPFAAASGKKLVEEEERLFQITDDLQRPTWRVIKNTLVDLWPPYVEDMRRACEEDGVAFLDLNAIEFHGWCFVDRVHMTDEGYFQAAQRVAEELR